MFSHVDFENIFLDPTTVSVDQVKDTFESFSKNLTDERREEIVTHANMVGLSKAFHDYYKTSSNDDERNILLWLAAACGEDAACDEWYENHVDVSKIGSYLNFSCEIETEFTEKSHLPGKVLISDIGDPSSKEGVFLSRIYGRTIGHKLPFYGRIPDFGVLEHSIVSQWPWAVNVASEIEKSLSVLRNSSNPDDVHLNPYLFVGSPGTGKTTLARHICNMLNLFVSFIPCSGAADSNGLSPTSRGFSSSRPGGVAQSVFTHRVANPALIFDEIDKSQKVQSVNGSAQGVLLSVVGQEKYHDSCLMSDIDVSSMTFIATANDLGSIHSALLDRFTVIRVPHPRECDVSVLLSNCRQHFAKKHGINEALIPFVPTSGLELLRKVLRDTKSVRSFNSYYDRIVETLIHECDVHPSFNS